MKVYKPSISSEDTCLPPAALETSSIHYIEPRDEQIWDNTSPHGGVLDELQSIVSTIRKNPGNLSTKLASFPKDPPFIDTPNIETLITKVIDLTDERAKLEKFKKAMKAEVTGLKRRKNGEWSRRNRYA